MPNVEETIAAPRRVLPVIYVLDTSGSMSGDRIAAVNVAMRETVEVLKDVAKENADAEIKIGVLTFASKAQWITDELVYLEDFFWNNLTAGGTTEVGAALDALYDQLSRSELLVSETGFHVPVIIFMSDGAPTDPGIWESKLKSLIDNNKWFRYATKIALAVGEEPDDDERKKRRDCLAKIVGNSEAVAEITDLQTLKTLIKVVSVTSSLINSKSRTTADAATGADVLKKTKDEMDNPDNVDIQPAKPDNVPADPNDPWNNWKNNGSPDNGKWS